jgi:hypothetical protein
VNKEKPTEKGDIFSRVKMGTFLKSFDSISCARQCWRVSVLRCGDQELLPWWRAAVGDAFGNAGNFTANDFPFFIAAFLSLIGHEHLPRTHRIASQRFQRAESVV